MPKTEKTYYSISEVSQMTGVEASTLRFWEKEIPQLNPPKTQGSTRRYRQEDIEVVNQIKFLSETCLYTLEGVRKCLDTKPKKVADISKAVNSLLKAREELLAIRRELNDIPAFREEMIIESPENLNPDHDEKPL